MTGNRHEQAVLVIMAYVVGFVTAFIAFGANQIDEATHVVYVPTSTVQAKSTSAPQSSPGNVASAASAYYEQGMLTTQTENGPVVLSVDAAMAPELTNDPQFAGQGLHQSLPIYAASPDGSFVYFCEQFTTRDSCRSFVYDTEQDVIIPVTFAGDPAEISITAANSAEWTENTLRISDYQVNSISNTWNMTTTQ